MGKTKPPLTISHPKLCQQWDFLKNGDLRPEDVTGGSNKRVWWICETNKTHTWEAAIFNRTAGSGICVFCCGQRVSESNCFATACPDLVKEWNYERNGFFTPTNVAAGSQKRVWWKCTLGHEWPAVVYSRKNGNGCPKCNHIKTGRRASTPAKGNSLQDLFPSVAADWAQDLNGDLTPSMVCALSNKRVWWRCKNGHVSKAFIYSRTNSHKCTFCMNQNVCQDNCLATTHPWLVPEWSKNNLLTPHEVLAGSCSKQYWWECEFGHEWLATPYSRTRLSQCPYCKGSVGEKLIAKILNQNEVLFKREYRIPDCRQHKPLPFDFAILKKDYNKQLAGLIEFHGKQHFLMNCFGAPNTELHEVQKRDQIKRNYCETNEIPLLNISYQHIDDAELLIINFLHSIDT